MTVVLKLTVCTKRTTRDLDKPHESRECTLLELRERICWMSGTRLWSDVREDPANPLDPGGDNLADGSPLALTLRQPATKLKVPQARHFNQRPPDAVHQVVLDQLVPEPVRAFVQIGHREI